MDSPLQLSAHDLAKLYRGEPLRLSVNDAPDVVIVLAEQYERLKQCVEIADADPTAMYPLIADVMPEDWDDLSVYPTAERP